MKDDVAKIADFGFAREIGYSGLFAWYSRE